MGDNIKYHTFYEELQHDPVLKQSLVTGSIPLLHIANHEFRDRNKPAELGEKGNIYVQTYETSKDRAQLTQNAFRAIHLPEEKLDENQPHKRHSHWLKVRNIPDEGPPLRFGAQYRTENERIKQETQNGDARWIDHASKNTKMLYLPDWKPINKGNWTEGKNFDLTSILYQGPRSDPPWQEMPVRYNHEGAEYIDSLEKVGEKIYRYRNKGREGGRAEFIGTIQQDALGKRQHISQSIRTYMSQKALGVDPTFDQFSKTSRLPFYKEALIQTNSLDHQIPFFHSQNQRSLATKDLMPRTEKIYKLSLKHFIPPETSHRQKQQEPLTTASNLMNEQMDSLKPQSQLDTPITPNVELKNNSIKNQSLAFSTTTTSKLFKAKPLSSLHSRSSMRTTNYTWNGQTRSFASLHKKKILETSSLQEKMQADPYYLPASQEAKDLVSKYFP